MKLAMNDPMPAAKGLKKRTMVKDVVGKCRAGTYIIPADGFTYGMCNELNAEGAGVAVNSWKVSAKSKPKTTMLSYPATNREALKTGILTAKGQRDYAKANPVMKVNPSGGLSAGAQLSDSKAWSHGRPFGIKSEQNETPMSLILSAPDDGPERDYPVYSQQQKGKLPAPRATKSSRLAEGACRAKNVKGEVSKVDAFRMKKFQNVQAKIVMGPA